MILLIFLEIVEVEGPQNRADADLDFFLLTSESTDHNKDVPFPLMKKLYSKLSFSHLMGGVLILPEPKCAENRKTFIKKTSHQPIEVDEGRII
jgi:hypothetical protein